MILSGIEVSKSICARLEKEVATLKQKKILPQLAIIRVGAREDDLSYERAAGKKLEALGILVHVFAFPDTCETKDLLNLIDKCNRDPAIHGILLFRPLPGHLDESQICNAISVEKDVDCMSERSLANIFLGKKEGFAPCTAQAVMEMIQHFDIPLMHKHVVILGRSLVVGKPLAMLMLNAHATPTVCHSKTADIAAFCRSADILIACAGKAKLVDPGMVHANSIILDVGINFFDGKLVGDVDFEAVQPHVQAITPVPGGIGSITTAVLAKHVVKSAAKSLSSAKAVQSECPQE